MSMVKRNHELVES
ncbi:hypothetical protein AYI68_g8174, partial [Smittium mucronatum]